MSPLELQHMAHGETVEIEPLTTIPALHLLEGAYESCTPLQIARVPLFVALVLKKANMCRIRVPQYLTLDALRAAFEEEQKKADEYAYVHPHLFVLADELLRNCYNVEDAGECRIAVEKIKELRFKKTYDGIRGMDGRAVNLNNLTAFEFNEIREFMLGSMKISRRLGRRSGSL
jgi:GINS complex subunit 2